MKVSTELSQRRIGLRFRFEIAEDAVEYSARDVTGERIIQIPYENINLEQPAFVTITATPVLRRLFGCALLLMLMAAAIGAFDRDIAMMWAVIALPLFVAAIAGKLTGWTNIKLKLFELEPYPPGAIGPMRIIDDEKGKQVLASLKQARKAKFRRLYAKANLAADPDREITRLTWLKDNDILTADEWQVELNRLSATKRDTDLVDGSLDEEKSGAIH